MSHLDRIRGRDALGSTERLSLSVLTEEFVEAGRLANRSAVRRSDSPIETESAYRVFRRSRTEG